MLTQRVVRAPFDMTWPILVEDDRFDLDRHVVRVALPAPGTDDQLDDFVSEFLSRSLSPQRPLWQLLIIEGLEDGRAVLVVKMHHALADGVSFAETIANFFDISPDVRPPAERPDTNDDEPTVTTSLGLLRQGIARLRGASSTDIGESRFVGEPPVRNHSSVRQCRRSERSTTRDAGPAVYLRSSSHIAQRRRGH